MKKRISSILLTVTLTISSFTSFSGQWINNGNWYYLDDNGNYLKNQWVGNYYLGADGVMMTNSWTPDGYYVGADGAWTGQSANSNSLTSASNNQSLAKLSVYGTYYDPEEWEYMDIIATGTSTISVEYYGYTTSGERSHGLYMDYIMIGENTWTSLAGDYGKYSTEYGAHTIYFDGYNTITAQANNGYAPVYYYRS